MGSRSKGQITQSDSPLISSKTAFNRELSNSLFLNIKIHISMTVCGGCSAEWEAAKILVENDE